MHFIPTRNLRKDKKIVAHLDANTLFNNLAVRLHNHKRPAWNPESGLSPKDLEEKFNELEDVEIKRAQALQKEHARQVHLKKVAARFNVNADKLTKWTAEKSTYLQTEEKIDSVEEAEAALDTLNLHEGEFTHVKSSALKDLTSLHDELVKERYSNVSDIKKGLEALTSAFAILEQGAKDKRVKLDQALANQKAIDDGLYRSFADAAKDFSDWLKARRDTLASNTDKALDDQLKDVQNSKAEAKTAEAKIAAIAAADTKVKARNLANNPYTNVSLEDAQAQWQQFEILCSKKVELLEEQIAEKKRGGLTEAQVKEIHDNFTHFDKDKNGFLTKRELRTCLQSLGEESTQKDVAKILAEYDKKGAGHLTLEEFQQFMKNNLGDTDTYEEIIKSFKYLSYDRDVITGTELGAVVNDRTFTDRHVSYLTKEMPKGDGDVYKYEPWTKAVFER